MGETVNQNRRRNARCDSRDHRCNASPLLHSRRRSRPRHEQLVQFAEASQRRSAERRSSRRSSGAVHSDAFRGRIGAAGAIHRRGRDGVQAKPHALILARWRCETWMRPKRPSCCPRRHGKAGDRHHVRPVMAPWNQSSSAKRHASSSFSTAPSASKLSTSPFLKWARNSANNRVRARASFGCRGACLEAYCESA